MPKPTIDSPPINPYAATSLDDDLIDETPAPQPRDGSFDPDVVSTTGMLIGTIGTTTLAGLTFGVLVVSLSAIWQVVDSSSWRTGPSFWSMVPALLAMACIVGGVLAAITGSLTTAVMLAVTTSMRYPEGRWRVDAVRVMHWVTGGFAGWLSAIVISGFDPFGLLIGIIPAIYGGAFNAIVGERKIRRARRRQAELDSAGKLADQFPLGEADRVPTLGKASDS